MVDALQAIGALDNTLFLYILGDNEASGEGGPGGALDQIASLNGVAQGAADILPHLDEIGGASIFPRTQRARNGPSPGGHDPGRRISPFRAAAEILPELARSPTMPHFASSALARDALIGPPSQS